MATKTIKLCDGWRIFEDGEEVVRTDNYQEVREFLALDLNSNTWGEITRILFCFGVVTLDCKHTDGTEHIVTVKVIPCSE